MIRRHLKWSGLWLKAWSLSIARSFCHWRSTTASTTSTPRVLRMQTSTISQWCLWWANTLQGRLLLSGKKKKSGVKFLNLGLLCVGVRSHLPFPYWNYPDTCWSRIFLAAVWDQSQQQTPSQPLCTEKWRGSPLEMLSLWTPTNPSANSTPLGIPSWTGLCAQNTQVVQGYLSLRLRERHEGGLNMRGSGKSFTLPPPVQAGCGMEGVREGNSATTENDSLSSVWNFKSPCQIFEMGVLSLFVEKWRKGVILRDRVMKACIFSSQCGAVVRCGSSIREAGRPWVDKPMK